MLKYFFKVERFITRSVLIKARKMSNIKKLLATSNQIDLYIKEVENELSEVLVILQDRQKNKELEEENKKLLIEVEAYKSELVHLEQLNNIIQVPVPEVSGKSGKVELPVTNTKNKSEPPPPIPTYSLAATSNKETSPALAQDAKPQPKSSKKPVHTPPESPDQPNSAAGDSKPSAKKKQKTEKKPTESASGSTTEEPPVDVSRLDFRVGKIVDVKKHPDADSLYVEQIDVGKDQNVTVVSGLVKHVPIEEMSGRMVVLLCNLKPAKMRGITSEAMVMCASTPDKVEVLSPPLGAVPGDLVHVEGFPRNPDAVLNPKKKIFETVAPDLRTDSQMNATYKGALWTVPDKGNVIAQTLTNVNIK